MRSATLSLLLWGLMVTGATADGQEKYVRIRTTPDAAIYDATDTKKPVFLGNTGDRLCLYLSRAKPITLVLKRPGYQEEALTLTSSNVPGETYPASSSPPIALHPAELMEIVMLVQDHPVATGAAVAGLVALAVAAGASLRLQRREKERSARLRSLLVTAEGLTLRGTRIGRYILGDVLGKGGMATVYNGVPEDSLDSTDAVAIKVIHTSPASSEEDLARFHREMTVASGLNHPNVVRMYEYGDMKGLQYIIMERIEGSTLRSLIVPPGQDEATVLRLLYPIVAALRHAHEHGIVHRDLKPENIMLDSSGRVKIMDFGLARPTEGARLTITGTTLGTPGYMAPEQVRAADVDARTDQYSLGVIIFELLTGRPPFEDASPVSVMIKHMQEPAPDVRQFNPDINAGLSAIVLRMMAKEPSDRYSSLDAVLASLREWGFSAP